MNYDRDSFLAGLAVGRQLRGWAVGGGGAAVSGVNLLRNPDFSVNTTGQTSWANAGVWPASAIDGWTVVTAVASLTPGGALHIEKHPDGVPTTAGAPVAAYLVQLISDAAMSLLVGRQCTLSARVGGRIWSATGVLGSGAGNAGLYTAAPWGTVRIYRYGDLRQYGVTVDTPTDAGVDVSAVKLETGAISTLHLDTSS